MQNQERLKTQTPTTNTLQKWPYSTTVIIFNGFKSGHESVFIWFFTTTKKTPCVKMMALQLHTLNKITAAFDQTVVQSSVFLLHDYAVEWIIRFTGYYEFKKFNQLYKLFCLSEISNKRLNLAFVWITTKTD
jgi:hypothetical protein